MRKTQNLLLFHGTSLENSVGIIEEGFVPSKKGKFGPGVYLTASSKCAADYAVRKSVEKKPFLPKNKSKTPMTMLNHEPQAHCVFVNEVLESEKLKVLKWNLGSTNDQFARYIEIGSVEDLQKETYDEDSGGRRLRSSPATQADYHDHYVCREDKKVVPRYFVQFRLSLCDKKL